MIEDAIKCTRCPLHKGRTNVVIGKGKEDADILFIGEAPGKNEDLQGKPFVGAAGKNLDKLLNEIGLGIDDVYIANILKCRPPENRDPAIDEIKTCTPWLLKQIEIISPAVICTLGNYSTKFILSQCDPEKMNSIEGITKLHGRIKEVQFNRRTYKVVPLFHPAAMLYNPKLRETLFKDIKVVKSVIEETFPEFTFKPAASLAEDKNMSNKQKDLKAFFK